MYASRLATSQEFTLGTQGLNWVDNLTDRISRLLRPNTPYQTVFEEATEGIMIHEPDTGEMIAVNPRACEMFGYDRDEVENLTVEDLISGRNGYDSDHAAEVTKKVLREGPQTLEWQYERRDGTSFWGEVKLKTITIRNKRRVLGLVSDISDRKRYEEALRRTEESAKQANRFKSAVLKNLSHAVRTPLTSILGYAEILKKRVEGEARKCASRIHESSHRLKETYSALLELAELEASARELSYERVHVAALVEQVVKAYRAQPKGQEIDLIFDPPTSTCTGQFDRKGLTRIIEELIDNALTFTNPGGTVQIELTPKSEHLYIAVTDTGQGIPSSFQPRLFNAFAQGPDTDRSWSRGAGIGLTIVKGLVDLMGGTVNVDSERGKGTKVTVRLPNE